MKQRRSIHPILLVALLTSLTTVYSCSKSGARQGLASDIVPDDILRVEQSSQSSPPDWQKVRDDEKKKLVFLAKHGDPRRLGFATPPDENSLTFLDPIPNALVHLADVKKYEAVQNPADLVKKDERLTFPILIDNNRVASSITLTKTGNGWRAIAYGEPTLIRAVMKARIWAVHPSTGSSLVAGAKKAEYRIVRVTGLNQSFLSAQGPGGLYFIPLFDRPNLGLQAGAPMLAKEVLLKLRQQANSFKGLPPTL